MTCLDGAISFIDVALSSRVIILSALGVTFLTPSCWNVAQSARLADLPGSFTYFNEMSSAIRQRHMAHVFNYLLSESTFAFEVPRGRMWAAPEDGNTFVCFISCGHIYMLY